MASAFVNNHVGNKLGVGSWQVKKFLKLKRKITMGEPISEGKMKDNLFSVTISVLHGLPLVSKKGRQNAEERLAGLAEKIVNNSAKATQTSHLLTDETRKELCARLINSDRDAFSQGEAGRVHEMNEIQRKWIWGGAIVTVLTAATAGLKAAAATALITMVAKFITNIKRYNSLLEIAEQMQEFVGNELSKKKAA